MDKKKEQPDNVYVKNLKEYINEDVEVKDKTGNIFKGRVLAVNFNHLNVVISDGKYITTFKDIAYIKRKVT